MSNTGPRLFTAPHKLAPDIEAYVRHRASREKMKLCRLLSTSEPTLEKLLDIGASEPSRDRIERYAAGLMRSEGLVPSQRSPAAARMRKAAPESTKIGIDRGDVRSENVLTEYKTIRVGQVWAIREPGDREAEIEVTHIIRDGMYGYRVKGITRGRKWRMVPAKRLVELTGARLVREAPIARSA